MKVLTITAHNVLRVKDVNLNLEGHNLFLIGGRNDQGKSSTMNAFVMAICGKQGCDFPDVPLRDGEKKGHTTIELDGLTVERHFRRAKDGGINETVKVWDADGNKIDRPQSILNQLYRSKGFDPLAFADMPAKKQAEELRKVVGIDFTDSDQAITNLGAERLGLKRDVDRMRGALTARERYDDAPAKEVPLAEIVKLIDDGEAYNRVTSEFESKVESLGSDIDRKKAKIDEYKAAIAKLEDEVKSDSAQLKDVKAELSNRDQIDVATLRERLDTTEADNAKVRANVEYKKAQTELNETESEVEKLTDRIEEIREEQRESLAKAPWPIPGLGLNDDGVIYKGLPFEQAAKSVRILTSVKMGMAMNPDLRMLVCQDGNDLDMDALNELDKVLKEHDFQMLLEVVTRGQEDEDRCCVVIEDGSVKGVNDDEPADTEEAAEEADAEVEDEGPALP